MTHNFAACNTLLTPPGGVILLRFLVNLPFFLFQGVGIDDMFVMISSWRKTDHYASAEDRMPEAFAEAAISITITSGNLCIQIT